MTYRETCRNVIVWRNYLAHTFLGVRLLSHFPFIEDEARRRQAKARTKTIRSNGNSRFFSLSDSIKKNIEQFR